MLKRTDEVAKVEGIDASLSNKELATIHTDIMNSDIPQSSKSDAPQNSAKTDP